MSHAYCEIGEIKAIIDLRMKKIFLFVSIGIMLLAIPLTVFFVGKNQEIRKRAAPASTLSLSPSAITKKVDETFTVEARIDTGTNQVGVVQIRVIYDPAKLQALDITNGPLAPSISVSGKIDATGKASITVGARSTTQPITGSGTIAILTMKAIAASATPVSVRFTPLPDTYANAIGEQDNVLIGTTPANVTILNADGTPAASGSDTIPTAAPSAALSLAPTPVATDSGEATASAVTIESIRTNEEITTDTPTFSGTAPPGATVTLTIYSEPRTVVVTVDANGNWTYTPEEGLESGPHTVTAMVSDPATDETSTTSVPFVINSDTENGIPVSGNFDVTIILVALGTLFMLSGVIIPLVVR
ncbi:MAG: hypothetical protein UY10_C0037G0004 [Microgenomates group bacterium GW2011_GWA2_47_8]|nr:MAG: hypothetical protein UY10_C0037G0004 [Microgenomates group bacterium GW2011_GWA2_47_8]